MSHRLRSTPGVYIPKIADVKRHLGCQSPVVVKSALPDAFEVVVVAAREEAHSPIAHLDHALGKAAQKRAVVGDGDDSTLEGIKRCLEMLTPLDVQVIE